eukprot:882815-Pyramimonas_sp.AAC.1
MDTDVGGCAALWQARALEEELAAANGVYEEERRAAADRLTREQRANVQKLEAELEQQQSALQVAFVTLETVLSLASAFAASY